eukprot:7628306-Alexandrium_andersonii.AAC.1
MVTAKQAGGRAGGAARGGSGGRIPPREDVMWGQPSEDFGRRQKDQIGAVSYTHLTLPTICSV